MNHENKTSAIESFKTDPVPKIVIKNSIPALIAMMMVMVYNLADTFFLGLTHNDLAVTAVSFATPLFMIFMSLGTLFGVGGTSVISRALGEGKTEYAKKACSFCMWACVAVGGVMMAVLWIFLDDVTVMLGASENSVGLTTDYLRIAVGCGVFSMISNCFSSNGNVYYATLHRCLLAENETTSSSSSPAAYGCFLSNCLVVRNGGRSSGAVNAVVYSKIVNCSIVGNVGRPASCNNYDNAAWNCAFALNEASDVPSKYGMTNSVSTASESSFAMSYASIGDVPSTNFFFAPLFDDYRLLPTSDVVSFGEGACLDLIPEAYRLKDFNGKPFAVSASGKSADDYDYSRNYENQIKQLNENEILYKECVTVTDRAVWIRPEQLIGKRTGVYHNK